MFAALQHGGPQQFGAILVLEPSKCFDASVLTAVLADRIHSVPRLRQRLMRVPPGCGRPIWVDDPSFSIDQHIDHVICPLPGDEHALLEVAAGLVTRRLRMDRPLWRATVVTGLADSRIALILVAQHALADGIGGLAVLGAVVDGAPAAMARPFPVPPPSLRQLAADALLSRVRAARHMPQRIRVAINEIRRARSPVIGRAAACSLLAPTGAERRVAVARARLDDIKAVAHRHGATVNDVVLSAISGALHTCLERRGEQVDAIVVGVPVAKRRTATMRELGNQLGEARAAIPTTDDPLRRLERVAEAMRASKQTAMRLTAVSQVVRALAAVGIYSWYMRRQRYLHIVVTNLRGPSRPMTLCGAEITDVLPLAVGGGGNVGVTFAALSYAGMLAVTVTADPRVLPDLTDTAAELQGELSALINSESFLSTRRHAEQPSVPPDRLESESSALQRPVRHDRGIRSGQAAHPGDRR
jgi:WS/DGAT/MGAT family acyltransferase